MFAEAHAKILIPAPVKVSQSPGTLSQANFQCHSRVLVILQRGPQNGKASLDIVVGFRMPTCPAGHSEKEATKLSGCEG
jgi:hypothetical protein